MCMSVCWWPFPFWLACLLLICSYGLCLPAGPCAHASSASMFVKTHTHPLCMLLVVHTYPVLQLLIFQVLHVCLLLLFVHASPDSLLLFVPCVPAVASMFFQVHMLFMLFLFCHDCLLLSFCMSPSFCVWFWQHVSLSCCFHISYVLLLVPFHTLLSVCCWCSCLSSLPFS